MRKRNVEIDFKLLARFREKTNASIKLMHSQKVLQAVNKTSAENS